MALVKGTNAYVSVAEADAYFVDRIDSEAWTSAGEPTKAQALVTATGLLDEMSWTGMAVSDSQALAFPRAGTFFDPRQGTEVYLDENTPERVIKATYELALHLLTNKGLLDETGAVTNLNVGSISLQNIRATEKIPASVRRMVSPLLVNQGNRSWWRAN